MEEAKKQIRMKSIVRDRRGAGRPCLRMAMKAGLLSAGYEPRALLGIKHPHIVQIYEVTREGEEIILREEYIKGQLLTELVRKWHTKANRRNEGRAMSGAARAWPLLRLLRAWREERRSRKIKSILRALCRALSYLHRMQPQIIHGDVKPDNIMIGSGGRVKLIDFSASQMIRREELPSADAAGRKGLSRDGSSGREAPEAGAPGGVKRYGTAGFTAPEVYEGQPGDPQQDIYGLGATLLYMLRGEEALATGDIEKAILLDGEGGPLSLLCVAYGCVRSDTKLRFQTADEVLGALRAQEKRRRKR